MYPALAVLQAIDNEKVVITRAESQSAVQTGELSVLWVGSLGGMEQDLVKRAGLPFRAIPAAGLHGVGLRALPGNLARLIRGFFQSRQILKEFRPDVIFFTGGYVAAPMALAGRSVPMAVYVPDIEPGMALKVLAKFVDLIMVTAEASKSYFSSKASVLVTGYPTRQELKVWNKAQAFEVFALEKDLPVLLVFGGSSGARSINQALWTILPDLLREMQIIHVTGNLDWKEASDRLAEIQIQLPAELKSRYHPYPYLHAEMGAAFTAANLVLARAGASTLGEFPAFGLPAILVPYPHAWRYQQVNAEYLEKAGAAKILPDVEMKTKLLPLVSELMANQVQLSRMQECMRSLAQPEAARLIGKALFDLAAGKGRIKT
ncbi:MAG TPA: UDP-N-acetylglucosamine--N-acetylmuramyl-(pentapeptide) pyrophosphoryl-undecaprenol N-acetylglucosamine transferase [Anaerolineales bacterium]|nr:UDP-N-acetylglucosamine--N-acetylmuramyl-(pentapeptide) pyrophosphoryl-undecaprenol N-acetylglucosamine transferase [Anaerolineales bacterium]